MSGQESEILLRKIEQRYHHEQPDTLQVIEQFPDEPRRAMLSGMQHLQISDGCTGGCPWCGFDVKRKIQKGFSFESIEGFFQKYGKMLPNIVALYWASDPADIGGVRKNGEKFDYGDVLSSILPTLRSDQFVHTSTSLPFGTEDVIRKVIKVLYSEYQRNGKFHPLRFSVQPDDREEKGNEKRIRELLLRSASEGVGENFVKQIQGLSVLKDEKTIQKLGKYFNMPGRDPFNSTDAMTIACYDGSLLSPAGIYSITMEAVTEKSKFGHTLMSLDPHKDLEIPVYVARHFYDTESVYELLNGQISSLKLLPRVNYLSYRGDGRKVEKVEAFSDRREALTMIFLSHNLVELTSLPTAILQSKSRLLETTIRYLQDASSRIADLRPYKIDDQEARELSYSMYKGALDILIPRLKGKIEV